MVERIKAEEIKQPWQSRPSVCELGLERPKKGLIGYKAKEPKSDEP